MNRRLASFAAVGAVALAATLGWHVRGARASGIPTKNTLTYSGTLLQGGQPVDGDRFILLKVWTNAGADLACSTIPAGNTKITAGRFAVPLDPTCVAVIHQNQDVEVEVVVDGVSMGKSAPSAVPYAVEADTASNFAPGSAIASLVPPGTVVPFAGVVGGKVTPPPGWMLCDGAAVSRAQYATLFGAIGTGWGSGDGATTFNLPDLRGRFLRGVDGGAGLDPDAKGRGAIKVGGNSGDAVGSVESFATALPHSPFGTDTTGAHTHDYQTTSPSLDNPYNIPPNTPRFGAWTTYATSPAGNHAHVVDHGGDPETRPANAAVNYIIKL